MAALQRDYARLTRRLAHAEAIIEVQKTYGPPHLQAISRPGLVSLRQRIRSQGTALAKMEIRASWSS